MTAAERLRDLLAVEAAATPGPWALFGDSFGTLRLYRLPSGVKVSLSDRHEMELIIAARNNLQPLVQALLDVLEVHKPFTWSFGQGPVTSCTECVRLGASEEQSEYPCPTAQAINKHLGENNE